MLFNEYLRKIPLVRIFLPFICGILCNSLSEISISGILFLLIIFFLIHILPFRQKNNPENISNFIFGILLNTYFFICGFILTEQQTIIYKSNIDVSNNTVYIGFVEEYPEQKNNSTHALIRINLVRNNNSFIRFNQKVITYFNTDDKKLKLVPGDRIILYSRLVEIKNKGNPGEFDAESYYISKKIHYKTFLKNENWKLLSDKPKINTLILAKIIRHKILEFYINNGFSGKSLAILTALSLGQKSFLDPEIKESFSNSGAMHILAVSGLHVGIIYLFISYLLKFLNRISGGGIIRLVVIISLLWLFAFITGLSPSVTRATTMLSFYLIGKTFKRQTWIYNIILSTAFILAVINPMIIFTPGFQLSFLAVIGIISIYPLINKLIPDKYFLIDRIWRLCSVSLSAQLATFPVCLFYFNIFPNYFLLTNVLVVPLAVLIIYSTLIMIILSPFAFFSEMTSVIVKFLINILNYITEHISNLPYSVSRNIYLSEKETFLIYTIIILIILLLSTRKIKIILFILPVIIFIQINDLVKINRMLTGKQIIIWNSPANNIQFIEGKKSFLFSDNPDENNKYGILSLASKYCMKNLTDNPDTINIKEVYKSSIKNELPGLYTKNGLMWFNGKKLLLLSQANTMTGDTINMTEIDYLVIFGKQNINFNKIKYNGKPKNIIIGAGVPEKIANNMLSWAKSLNIRTHSVKTMGAFIISFKKNHKHSRHFSQANKDK